MFIFVFLILDVQLVFSGMCVVCVSVPPSPAAGTLWAVLHFLGQRGESWVCLLRIEFGAEQAEAWNEAWAVVVFLQSPLGRMLHTRCSGCSH